MGLPNNRTQFVDLAFFAVDRIQQGRHVGVVNSQGINYSILCGFTLSHKIQLPRIHTHMSREKKKEKKKGLPILVIFSCALCHYCQCRNLPDWFDLRECIKWSAVSNKLNKQMPNAKLNDAINFNAYIKYRRLICTGNFRSFIERAGRSDNFDVTGRV